MSNSPLSLQEPQPRPSIAPPPRMTNARFWEDYRAEHLRAIADKLAQVIDHKERQIELFDPPEAAPAAAPAPEPRNQTLATILSPSQANLYLGCSAKWWFRYGAGLPDPRGGSACRGTAVHKTVAKWFALQLADVGATVEDMGEVYDDAWDAAAEETSFAADDDIAELKRTGAQLTRKYLEEAAPEIVPAAVDQIVCGEIGGVMVRGYVDLVDADGRIIDLKTAGRKPSGIEPAYAFQLATYQQLLPGANGKTRLDTLVATKTPAIVTIEHATTDAERQLTAALYPAVREGIREGLYLPNRGSNTCSRKYCNFWQECESQWGGHVA